MQIEEGKFYRTRDGRKVGPMGKPEGSTYNGLRAISSLSSEFTDRRTWWDNGRAHAHREGPEDLISEWIDEPASPIRTITRQEIIYGDYGKVRISSVVDVPDCDRPEAPSIREIGIEIDDSLSPDELEAAAKIFTDIAKVLRGNGE